MSSDISRLIIAQITLADKALMGDGLCTHDIFEGIGGEETIPRKKLYPLLKLMRNNSMLLKGMGTDSRGKLAFKWSVSSDRRK